MQFSPIKSMPLKTECDVLVLGKFKDKGLVGELGRADKLLKGALGTALASEKFEGEEGKTLMLHTLSRLKAPRLLLVGLGDSKELSTDTVRKAAIAAAKRIAPAGGRPLISLGTGPVDGLVSALTEGFMLGAYSFDKYKSKDGDSEPTSIPKIDGIMVRAEKTTSAEFNDGVRTGRSLAESINFVRDIVNEPPVYLTPTRLAHYAEEIASEGGLKIEVLEKEDMYAMGMNGILAVNKGSSEPPKFIHMTYKPTGRSTRTVAIVGKGITFDSGGLSLKPAESMRTMKMDMSGAGTVLGAMKAISTLKPRCTVHALISSTENMTGGSAYKVDDVIRAMNGKTIEVFNTDAEGRIVLADALSYAVELKVDEIVDLATLTGACIVALGGYTAGLMGNDPALMNKIKESASRAGEKVWELPMDPELRPQIKSELADIKNTGSRWGGAITAAMFLENFVDKTPWVHIDIAGPAYIEKGGAFYPKGGTGFGVRTIVNYLLGG